MPSGPKKRKSAKRKASTPPVSISPPSSPHQQQQEEEVVDDKLGSCIDKVVESKDFVCQAFKNCNSMEGTLKVDMENKVINENSDGGEVSLNTSSDDDELIRSKKSAELVDSEGLGETEDVKASMGSGEDSGGTVEVLGYSDDVGSKAVEDENVDLEVKEKEVSVPSLVEGSNVSTEVNDAFVEAEKVSIAPVVSDGVPGSTGEKKLPSLDDLSSKETDGPLMWSSEEGKEAPVTEGPPVSKGSEETKLTYLDENNRSPLPVENVMSKGAEEVSSTLVDESSRSPIALADVEPEVNEYTKLPASEESYEKMSVVADNEFDSLQESGPAETVLAKGTSSECENPESGGDQTVAYRTGHPLQRASWKNCCGLYEVLWRSAR